ncbi:MAG: hypothetical protein KF893_02970 [Caldilineaceae bacterium]|nr:hypothetical protein [Caldilineaceae bacterium]
MTYALLDEKASYTFLDYFALNVDARDVLSHFGYSFSAETTQLPQWPVDLVRIDALRSRISESLPYLSMTSEAAKREFLIAPVLLEVVHHTKAWVRVEYPLVFNDQLKGTLDYYLEAEHRLLIVEAKNADLVRGFTQLAVELVALDKWTESPEEILYGAISVGDVWRFGRLDRQQKHVIQDLNLYRVPMDLGELLNILVGILKGKSDHPASGTAHG